MLHVYRSSVVRARPTPAAVSVVGSGLLALLLLDPLGEDLGADVADVDRRTLDAAPLRLLVQCESLLEGVG